MDEHNYDDEGELSDDEFQELSFDDLLKRVGSNDPSLTSVKVSTRFIPNDDDDDDYRQHRLERLGTAISTNTQLTALMFDGYRGQLMFDGYRVRFGEAQREAETPSLWDGIACNQSIERFHFNNCGEHLGNACRILTPLFKRNRVERIRIDNCNLSIDRTRLLVTSLAKFDSLKEFALTRISNFLDDPDSQQAARELMQALPCHSRLRKLDLSCTNVGKLGCSALVDLLNNPNINLTVLDLNRNDLGDAEAAALSSGMAGNASLKEINLAGNKDITQAGWQAIFDSLFGALDNPTPTCVLEDLGLGDNQLNAEVMYSLIDALTSNMSLKSLNLSFNRRVTGAAWQRFFSIVLSNPSSGLEKLDLAYCGINDATFRSLITLLNYTKLKVLDLESNCQITYAGWEIFCSVLESPNTALEELHLDGNEMNNATCTAFLNSLAGNKKLKKLMLDHRSVDWEHLMNLLCNADSIMDTYNSNHILEKLGCEDAEVDVPLPEEVESLLQINRESSPSQAARLKIIKTHFNGGFVTQTFVGMDLNVLPHAMAWMGRDGRAGDVDGHYFRFIKSISSLFENVN